MNPILKALNIGIDKEDIYQYLVSAFPHLREKVKTATSLGFSKDDILNYLKSFDKEKFKNATQSLISKKKQADLNSQIKRRGQFLTQAEQADITEAQKRKKFETLQKRTLNLAGTALGTYALSRAIPKTAQALGSIIPGMKQPAPAESVPATPVTPQEAQRQQALRKFNEKLKKKPLVEDLTDQFKQTYGNPNVQEAQQPEQIGAGLEQSSQELVSPEQRKKEIEKIVSMPTETVGSLALTPQGEIGEIESVKNGIAKIKVGDSFRTRKTEDIDPIPISQPDLADLYKNLLDAIPEEKRSSVINFAGYDADANELIFRPHSGAAYVYKDIPKEFADKLKNAMFKAKTTGENFYGAWTSGEESRFAGLAQLIRDLQKAYGGKGKEYIRKYETLFDILEEPEKAKKAKSKIESEKRKIERKKKKDEKKKKHIG